MPPDQLITVNQDDAIRLRGALSRFISEPARGYEVAAVGSLLLDHALELLNRRATNGIINPIAFALDHNHAIWMKHVTINPKVIGPGRETGRVSGSDSDRVAPLLRTSALYLTGNWNAQLTHQGAPMGLLRQVDDFVRSSPLDL